MRPSFSASCAALKHDGVGAALPLSLLWWRLLVFFSVWVRKSKRCDSCCFFCDFSDLTPLVVKSAILVIVCDFGCLLLGGFFYFYLFFKYWMMTWLHACLTRIYRLWHTKNMFSSTFSWFYHPGPHGFQERLAATQEAMKNKNVVNLGAIRQGMKRFQFLLNCCEPGTIPDASILAAALDLVSSS